MSISYEGSTAPYNRATCQDCSWTWKGRAQQGGYKQIKRHVEKTGHVVVRLLQQTTVYSRE